TLTSLVHEGPSARAPAVPEWPGGQHQPASGMPPEDPPRRGNVSQRPQGPGWPPRPPAIPELPPSPSVGPATVRGDDGRRGQGDSPDGPGCPAGFGIGR